MRGLGLVCAVAFLSACFDERTPPREVLITDVYLPRAYTGRMYRAPISLIFDIGHPITWSIVDGQLPKGLVLEPSSGPAVAVSGIPSRSGFEIFTLEAAGADGRHGTHQFTLEVDSTLQITGHLPDGMVGVAYEASLRAEDGVGQPFVWYTEGSVPGLRLEPNADTLSLVGTPLMQGSFSILVFVTDGEGNSIGRVLPMVVL